MRKTPGGDGAAGCTQAVHAHPREAVCSGSMPRGSCADQVAPGCRAATSLGGRLGFLEQLQLALTLL